MSHNISMETTQNLDTATSRTGDTEMTDATAPAYLIDAEQLGPEFRGTASDLPRFAEILAEQCGRDRMTIKIAQHIRQPAGCDEPSEWDWHQAVDAFAAERPDLFDVGADEITAVITARDSDTTAERPGSVDAIVYVDDRPVGECTLCTDPHSGLLVTWGQGMYHWADDALQEWLRAGGDVRERSEDVEHAVREADRRAGGSALSWCDGRVVDVDGGGTWHPGEAARAEIEASGTPYATAIYLCHTQPQTGRRSS